MRTTTVVWFAASLLCLQFLSSLDAAPSARYDLIYSSRHYFTNGRGHSRYQIRRLRIGAHTSTQLTHVQTDCGGPLPSPDGRRIAYQTGTDIWLMAANGGSKRRVPLGGSQSSGLGVCAWMPDSRRLLLEGSPGIYLLEVSSGHVRKVVDGDEPRLAPRGGPRLLVEYGDVDHEHIGVFDLAGRKVWGARGYPAAADWSPNADRVAISRVIDWDEPQRALLVMRRARDGKQVAAYPLAGDVYGAWRVCEFSPRGDSVIVGGEAGRRPWSERFYTLSLRTGKLSLLGTGTCPRWSPDGRYVAWASQEELLPLPDKRVVYTSQVVLYDVRTGKHLRLTSGLQITGCVDWVRRR